MVERPTQSEVSGSSPTPPLQVPKAHQRLIREKIAASGEEGLLGSSWKEIDLDIKKSVVKPIDRETAKEIILKYEWLGTMPSVALHYFGIFFGGVCGGAVVYCADPAENMGVWDKYGYTGKIICLGRGACVHWAHPHSASKLIRTSMKMLPEKYKVVTCTVDPEAGEIGTIYQACGFDYVGVLSQGGNSVLITPEGKRISSRQLGRLYGTKGVAKLQAMGIPAQSTARKSRYFGFVGSKTEIKELRAAIADRIQPYPKRSPIKFEKDWLTELEESVV